MPSNKSSYTEEEMHNMFEDVDKILLMDPILEAEAQHGPIFRRELFNAAYAAHIMVLGRSPEEQRDACKNKITLRDIYGIERTMPLTCGFESNGQSYAWKRMWGYNSLQSLGDMIAGPNQEYLLPYTVEFQDYPDEDCFDADNIEEQAKLCTEEWKASDICHRLTAFLEEHVGKSMRRVDQILCFGLGCISADKWCERSFIQHLAGSTVRDIIARNQHNSDSRESAPKLLAQDPCYCPPAKAWLATHFNMSFLDDPEGFKAVDEHTFILSFAPNVPVRQIVQGLTYDEGGPAGMFCDSIKDDGLSWNGKKHNHKRDTFVKDGVLFTPYTTCPDSPALWKYKTEGTWMECGDKGGKNWFGNVGIYLRG